MAEGGTDRCSENRDIACLFQEKEFFEEDLQGRGHSYAVQTQETSLTTVPDLGPEPSTSSRQATPSISDASCPTLDPISTSTDQSAIGHTEPIQEVEDVNLHREFEQEPQITQVRNIVKELEAEIRVTVPRRTGTEIQRMIGQINQGMSQLDSSMHNASVVRSAVAARIRSRLREIEELLPKME